MQKRLTVEMIRKEMAETSMELISDNWFDSDNPSCGCPMAIHAVAGATGVEVGEQGDAEAYCYGYFGSDYTEGFVDGFDVPFGEIEETKGKEWRLGHDDGATARMFLKPIDVGELT